MKDGVILKGIRTFYKLSQDRFSTILGTHQQIIAMIENNKRNIPKSVIENLYTHNIDWYKLCSTCNSVEEVCEALHVKPKEKVCEVTKLKEKVVKNNYKVNITLNIEGENKAEVMNKIISSFTDISKIEIMDVSKE